ncbi:MAG: hypothetical protein PHO07_06285 [Pirellulales bacterium]|jgi:hypothetical protein|nr:hypothetical protein [Thermoguttaceae bacterium]MDD4786767.1 hypothetical protein [Pirellulales bacterium]MDI9446214.1 hypothetical protein [Planctomycetota bacterium]NLY99919.1 hypothetical protein [Pirellulaceae bacterium]
MLLQRVEKLRLEYTDKYVVVDGNRPDLARFAGKIGRVHTVNAAGRALVEFDDRGWYDLELDFLKVIDKPKPKEPARRPAPAKAPPAAADEAQAAARGNLSELELARLEKDAGAKATAEKTAKHKPADAAGEA